MNRDEILRLLRENREGFSQTDIAAKLSIPRTTVYDNLRRMSEVEKIVLHEDKVGRPHTIWRLKR